MIGKIFRAFSNDWKKFYGNEDSFKWSVPLIFGGHGSFMVHVSVWRTRFLQILGLTPCSTAMGRNSLQEENERSVLENGRPGGI